MIDWHLWLEVGHYVLLPGIYWAGKAMLNAFQSSMTTDVMTQVDARFAEHEKCDDRIRERLDRIEELLLVAQVTQRKAAKRR